MLGWKTVGGMASPPKAKPPSCPVWSRRMGPWTRADRRNPHGEAGVRLSAFTRASPGAGPPRCRSASIAATYGSQYSAVPAPERHVHRPYCRCPAASPPQSCSRGSVPIGGTGNMYALRKLDRYASGPPLWWCLRHRRCRCVVVRSLVSALGSTKPQSSARSRAWTRTSTSFGRCPMPSSRPARPALNMPSSSRDQHRMSMVKEFLNRSILTRTTSPYLRGHSAMVTGNPDAGRPDTGRALYASGAP